MNTSADVIGNVVRLTYKRTNGRAPILLDMRFFSEDEYREIMSGAVQVFGKPDNVDVQRDIDLSSDSDRRPPGKICGKDPTIGSLPRSVFTAP